MEQKMQNNLNGLLLYSIGNMEFSDGRTWRNYLSERLKPFNIRHINPYNDFCVGKIPEDGVFEKIKDIRASKDYSSLDEVAKNIRNYDLAAVAKSDFLIAYVNTDIFIFGSVEELVESSRLNKPIFVFVEQGKQNAPLWLYGLVGEKNIYSSLEEILVKLQEIDTDIDKADLDKWAFLSPDLK